MIRSKGLLSPEDAEQTRRYLQHDAQWNAFCDIRILVSQLRRCVELEDYRALQQELGIKITRVDDAANDAHRRASEAKRRLDRLHISASRETVEAAQVTLDAAEFDRSLYLRLGRQYQTVGDAMAYQLHGFDSLRIYALGMNQSPGITARKAGARAEEIAIEQAWQDQGAFALRHDFTNCLRIGDLSIFDPTLPYPYNCEVVEVKASNKSPKGHQRQRSRILVDLVHSHIATKLDGTILAHLDHEHHTPNGPVPTNLTLLRDAIEQAEDLGVGTASNEYLAFSAVSLLHPDVDRPNADMQDRFAQVHQLSSAILIPPGEFFIEDSYNKMLRLNSQTPEAPFTVYPLFPDQVAALVCGYLYVTAQFNAAVLDKALRAAGLAIEWLVSKPVEQQAPIGYLRVKRRNVTLTIHAPPLLQVIMEGLLPEELVTSVVAQLDAQEVPDRAPGKSAAVSTFTGLEEIWRWSLYFQTEEVPGGVARYVLKPTTADA